MAAIFEARGLYNLDGHEAHSDWPDWPPVRAEILR